MKIAFYAPLKSPRHPVPSGDRLMARLLLAALEQAGHETDVVSEFRAFMRDPHDDATNTGLHDEARSEATRISALWEQEGVPDIWFCYHPYYKSPDLIGPELCRIHDVAYITAESSWSHRRNEGVWGNNQQLVLTGATQATVNICFTRRDRNGLHEAVPEAIFEMLPPFIDAGIFLDTKPEPQPFHMATVAMMRPGDKLESYRILANALEKLPAYLPWHLRIVGDGPCHNEVKALFSRLNKTQLTWHGELGKDAIASVLSRSSLYVWPGQGEAYGLAFLEAQAAGLPVIAQNIAGVPEVVLNGRTGILTPPGDIDAYAAAITGLLEQDKKRIEMALEAKHLVQTSHTLQSASARLAQIIQTHVKARHDTKGA